jgi:site-specific recombinase XerD
MTATDLIERFRLEYQVFHAISPKRAREQRALLEDLRSQMGRDLDTITASDFQQFAARLIEAGFHVNTVRKKMNMVRAWISWAFAVNVIDGQSYLQLKQVKNPRGSTGQAKPNPYTRKEMDAFWETFEARWPRLPTSGRRSRALRRWVTGQGKWAPVWRHAMRIQLLAMTRLALDLGLRAHEIHGLSVHDLHYDNEYIVVWGKADPNTGLKKVRSVPFTEASRRAITEWVEFRGMMRPDHDRAWVTCYAQWRNNPMDMARFETLLQSTIGPKWRWHRLRHTCATEWLRAGMELETVSRLLGHSSLVQTMCYAEITKHDLQLAVNRHEGKFSGAVQRDRGEPGGEEEVSPAAA